MPLYSCERCAYSTHHKNNLRAHLKRRTICNPHILEPTVETLLAKLDTPSRRPVLECPDCSKTFTTQANLEYHINHAVCKLNHQSQVNRNTDSVHQHRLIQSIPQTNTVNANSSTVVSSNTNTTISHSFNTTHININIQPTTPTINDFGNEYIGHITDAMKKEYLIGPGSILNGICRLVKDLHFNAEVPQNRNILFKSGKQQTFFVKTDGAIRDVRKMNCIPALISKCWYNILIQYYTANKETDADIIPYATFVDAWVMQHINSMFTVRYYRLMDSVIQVIKDNTTDTDKQNCMKLLNKAA